MQATPGCLVDAGSSSAASAASAAQGFAKGRRRPGGRVFSVVSTAQNGEWGLNTSPSSIIEAGWGWPGRSEQPTPTASRNSACASSCSWRKLADKRPSELQSRPRPRKIRCFVVSRTQEAMQRPPETRPSSVQAAQKHTAARCSPKRPISNRDETPSRPKGTRPPTKNSQNSSTRTPRHTQNSPFTEPHTSRLVDPPFLAGRTHVLAAP